MSHSIQDKAIALAGLTQFALYAHELATKGNDDFERVALAKRAIYSTEPNSVIDVFGDYMAVRQGADFAIRQLRGHKKDATLVLIARYMGQMMRLASQLQHRKKALNDLGQVIQSAKNAGEFEEERILNTAYKEIISPLKPRIMLQGHPSYLENTLLQNRARILLLAGVRSAILWRQCGGRFLTLLFRRKALLEALSQL